VPVVPDGGDVAESSPPPPAPDAPVAVPVGAPPPADGGIGYFLETLGTAIPAFKHSGSCHRICDFLLIKRLH